jgi:hypothetical protein
MAPEEISRVVTRIGSPKTVMVVPDNIRRTGIVYWNLQPKDKKFERKLFERLNKPYMRVLEEIFSCGVKCIIAPSLTHGNLSRDERYVREHLRLASYWIFKDREWLSFYDRLGIRVKVYGDLEYFGKIAESLGYGEAVDWCKQVEEDTKDNSDSLLLWGVACSGSIETERLVRIGIDFFKTHGHSPSREELIKLYYGEDLDYIDIFIRPGEIRDSDCQPPLIGGKSEMYFPVTPLTQMEDQFFKDILYDYLFCRLRTYSKKRYGTNIDEDKIRAVKRHYFKNKNVILGVGNRVGEFWIPSFVSAGKDSGS